MEFALACNLRDDVMRFERFSNMPVNVAVDAVQIGKAEPRVFFGEALEKISPANLGVGYFSRRGKGDRRRKKFRKVFFKVFLLIGQIPDIP